MVRLISSAGARMIPSRSHELRRELRGMWTVNAWLHHDDCSSRNTLDMLVKEDGPLVQCVINFSGTLGAAYRSTSTAGAAVSTWSFVAVWR